MSEFATVDRRFWRTQLPVDYLDTTLVINVWETVSADLAGGLPAALLWVLVEQTNNAATVETLEFEITINGTAYTRTLTGIASGAVMSLFMTKDLATGDFDLLSSTSLFTFGSGGVDVDHAYPFKAESVGLIRVRQTTTVDVTTAQIEVNVVWDKLAG